MLNQQLGPPMISTAPVMRGDMRQGLEEGGRGQRRAPLVAMDIAALSAGTPSTTQSSRAGYTPVRSPEVSVRAALPRYPRAAGPPPLASSSTFLAQPPGMGSQAQAANVLQAAAPSTGPYAPPGGMAIGSSGNPVPVRPAAASRKVAAGPPAAGEPAASNSNVPGNSTPPGPTRPRPVAATPVAARAQSLEPAKPAVKAIASSRSLVPPPARIASSFVPAASRFYSYTPAPGARKTSSYTPSVSQTPQPAKVLGTSGDHTSVRFLEGLHRPATSPLLAASQAGTAGQARPGEDELMSSVRSVSTPPRAVLEGLASGQGGATYPPSVWAYNLRPATSSTAPRACAPKVFAPREAPPPQSLAEFQAERATSSSSSAYTDFMGGGWLNMQGFNLEALGRPPAVPNTAPPLMRYNVTKDGAVEQTEDTMQPAHVPAVAAAAMAALEATAGKNVLFPNLSERERQRIEDEDRRNTSEDYDMSPNGSSYSAGGVRSQDVAIAAQRTQVGSGRTRGR